MAERSPQRSTGDEPGVGAAAGRRVHDRRRLDAGRGALFHQLDERRRVAERTGRGAPPDRNRVRRRAVGGERVGQGISGDHQLAPVALVGTGVVQLGAEQRRQELVARRSLGSVARQHEVHLDPEHGAGRRRQPAVVRLRGADGHERAGAGADRIAAQELQLADLVAAHAQAGQVVALDPQPLPARQLRPALERCRQQRQRRTGEVTEHGPHARQRDRDDGLEPDPARRVRRSPTGRSCRPSSPRSVGATRCTHRTIRSSPPCT